MLVLLSDQETSLLCRRGVQSFKAGLSPIDLLNMIGDRRAAAGHAAVYASPKRAPHPWIIWCPIIILRTLDRRPDMPVELHEFDPVRIFSFEEDGSIRRPVFSLVVEMQGRASKSVKFLFGQREADDTPLRILSLCPIDGHLFVFFQVAIKPFPEIGVFPP